MTFDTKRSIIEVAYCSQVAVNKSKNDDFITTELERMANYFPRTNLLDEIYPNAKVTRFVLEIHSGVIGFSRKAAEYFLHRSSESISFPISVFVKS